MCGHNKLKVNSKDPNTSLNHVFMNPESVTKRSGKKTCLIINLTSVTIYQETHNSFIPFPNPKISHVWLLTVRQATDP